MQRPLLILALLAASAPACERPPAGRTAGGSTPTNAEPPPDAPPPDPELVRFSTADGWTIAGDLRLRQRGGLAVVLVHQLSSNRGEWAAFAAQLAAKPTWQTPAGTITTLALDLRGHGESTSGPDGTARWQSFGNDRARWMGLEHDVAAAVDYVRQRAGTTRIVIVGSSIGGTAATLYAARSGAPVVGLALLSPGTAYRGIELGAPLAQFVRGRGSVLMVTAAGDTYSADSVRDLQSALARGSDGGLPSVEVERYDNASAHGVSLGAQGVHPELWTRVERWVRTFETRGN